MSSLSSYFTVRQVPQLFWSAPVPLTLRPPVLSVVMLCFGLTVFGIGEALMIAAGAGVSPWTVLAQGLSLALGLSIGSTTFLVSVAVLILWVPLRQTPGIGTVLNAIIIAAVMDIFLPYLPRVDKLPVQLLMATAGVLMVGLGSAIYLIANLGPGPRDGLMTGLQRRTGLPIMWVRLGIEIVVVLLGWQLGGVVGAGTVIFALGIGPAVSVMVHSLSQIFPQSGAGG